MLKLHKIDLLKIHGHHVGAIQIHLIKLSAKTHKSRPSIVLQDAQIPQEAKGELSLPLEGDYNSISFKFTYESWKTESFK